MQRAQDGSTELVPEPPSPRPGLSPAIAFALLAIVVAVIAAAVFLTRPETELQAAATKPTSTSPNFALTNEEAIARFQELRTQHLQAYRSADPSLVEGVFTPTSPVAQDVRKEIRHLVRDRVTAWPTYKTRSLSVLTNEPTEIQIQQKVVFSAMFRDLKGRDITKESADQAQTIVWTLRLHQNEWLLHDALITSSKPVSR